MATPARRAAALPPEERREALIAATLPLVLEHGTDVSTRLIAEAAGVAEGTIFRVYPSKQDLMEAVLASAFDPSTVVDAIAELDRTAPLEQRLIAAVELMQARGRRIAGLMHAFAAHGSLPHREHDRDRGWRIRASEARVVDALALLVEPDHDRLRCSPQETARRLRLITLALSSPRLADTDPLPPEEIVSLLLDGLRRRAAAPTQPALTMELPAC
jgi:AcrR family transcriptional regulator